MNPLTNITTEEGQAIIECINDCIEYGMTRHDIEDLGLVRATVRAVMKDWDVEVTIPESAIINDCLIASHQDQDMPDWMFELSRGISEMVGEAVDLEVA